jgi:hypothetical protein
MKMRKHFTNGLVFASVVLFSSNPCLAEWWITTVDSNAYICGRAAIDLDSLERPCVLYDCESKSGPVRYAVWNPDSTWTIETVTSSALGGLGLELDSQDNPHAVWKWWYAGRDSTGWHPVKFLGPAFGVRTYPSLALDSKDRPHIGIFYRCSLTFDTAFFHYYLNIDSTGWLCDTLEYGRYGMYDTTLVFWDYGISIAIDDSDCVHAVYAAGDLKLFYAKKMDGEWHKEWVDTLSNGIGFYPCMVLDDSGCPSIAYSYRDGDIFQMRFARRNADKWIVSVADSMRAGGRNSLAIGPDNHPRMCYLGHEGIWHAWFDGAEWHTTMIEEGRIGYSTDVKVDSRGDAHITYVYDTEKVVRYARGRGYVGVERSNYQLATGNRQLSIWPNPFVSFAEVRGERMGMRENVEAQGIVPVQVYDLGGRLVEKTESRIIGRALRPGVYFVKVKGYEPAKITKIGRTR